MEEFSHIFEGVEEPRRSNATRHDLHEMLMIWLLSTLCGGEGCCDMALFGREKEAFLRGFMRLEHGIPSHDAFSDLFHALDPVSFQPVMARLVAGFARELDDVIAIDGKVLRQSFTSSMTRKDALTMVQAFAAEARLVLGQIAVREKSNEINAMPALLDLLDLEGRIVTDDAMHTQRATAKTISQKGGDWLLVLKGNQGALFEDVSLFMGDAGGTENIASFQTVDADHGRLETRLARVSTEVAWLHGRHDWPGIAAIATITATRETGGNKTTATRHYISSLPLGPERLLAVARAHWAIENSLHWVLDVAMNEDRARNRTGNGPENLAILRRIALNLARSEPSKGSMRGKLKRAGWNDNFILDLIRAAA